MDGWMGFLSPCRSVISRLVPHVYDAILCSALRYHRAVIGLHSGGASVEVEGVVFRD